jgi:hypothetical protein
MKQQYEDAAIHHGRRSAQGAASRPKIGVVFVASSQIDLGFSLFRDADSITPAPTVDTLDRS